MNSEKITAHRETLGYTQSHMAGVCGISQSYLSMWEAGVAVPSADTIRGVEDNLIRHCQIQAQVLQQMAETISFDSIYQR